jgi:F0F1-type ATP synthase epsilon subunit
MAKASDLTYKLLIRNRQDVVFEGEVNSISSVNGRGKFDVLAHHANFISLIERYVIIRQNGKPDQTIKITNGIMHVEENLTHVYLES